MHERWDELCARVGAFGNPAESDLTFEMLVTLYENPPRSYHTLEHIAWCLGAFDGARRLAEDAEAVEFAVWMHDCVFIPERSDNEARSADAAGMIAGLLGAPPMFASRVRELILATAHPEIIAPGDASLIADVDLSVLGAETDAYARYAEAIEAEYAFAGESLFVSGRRAFLERMLGRRFVYRTAYFRSELESRARTNMERELATLEGRGESLGE